MKKLRKISIILLPVLVILIPVFIFAATVNDLKYSGDQITGTIDGETLTFSTYERNIEGYIGYFADTTNYDTAAKTGDYYILDVYEGNILSARLHKLHADGTTSKYVFQNQLVTIAARTQTSPVTGDDYRLFPDLDCTGNDALVCWLGAVWKFSQIAILVLAIAAIVMAGIIYMTSAGNPKQIATAKKIIIGALTGVAVMVLGRFFLVNIIGVEWIW